MTAIGAETARLDGPAKVTGTAQYGSDATPASPAYAVLVTSAIAKGRITSIDTREARAVSGILDVFTYENIGEIEAGEVFDQGGYMGTSIAPLASAEIFHDGQIVALVVANTFEAAREAAHRLKIDYAPEAPSATFDSGAAETVAGKDASPKHKDPAVGDAEDAFASAPVKVDARYATSTEHHNPIELFTTICEWRAGKL